MFTLGHNFGETVNIDGLRRAGDGRGRPGTAGDDLRRRGEGAGKKETGTKSLRSRSRKFVEGQERRADPKIGRVSWEHAPAR